MKHNYVLSYESFIKENLDLFDKIDMDSEHIESSGLDNSGQEVGEVKDDITPILNRLKVLKDLVNNYPGETIDNQMRMAIIHELGAIASSETL